MTPLRQRMSAEAGPLGAQGFSDWRPITKEEYAASLPKDIWTKPLRGKKGSTTCQVLAPGTCLRRHF